MSSSKTILFIHGMFMNHTCWNEWVKHFENKGYTCLAPDWPFHSGIPSELRKNHPDNDLGKLTLTDVLIYFEDIIKTQKEQPILIGHSMGGLLVQLLINKGYGACGIAIDPAPPKGVFTTKWSFLKSNLPAINPFKGNSPALMTFKQFQYAFVNGFSLEEQKRVYETFVVPESRNVPRSSTSGAGKIDFEKDHAPLLIIAGGDDHIIPASLNKSNFNKYKTPDSRTDFKEFPGRTHFIIGQNGWQVVADYVQHWISSN